MSAFGLTQAQTAEVLRVLAEAGVDPGLIRVFGSRATGRATERSDLDLAVLGTEAAQVVERLRTLFEESRLPFRVDLAAYCAIEEPALRAHIDRVGLPLARAA